MQGIAVKERGQVDHGKEMAGSMLEHMVTCEVEKTRVSLSEEAVDVEFHSCTEDGKWEMGCDGSLRVGPHDKSVLVNRFL